MNDWLKVFYQNIGAYNSVIGLSLSQHYKYEPLGKHIKILGGYAFKSSEYKNQGIPVIRISDFQDEKIDLSNVKLYDEKPIFKNYELAEADIIIALTGGTIGKLAIVQPGLGKLYLNQRVGKFKVLNPDVFESEYVYWIARGVENQIKSLAWGAAIPNVSGKQIESLRFVFPPKPIQSSIIDFFNDLKNDDLKNKEYFAKEVEIKIISIQQSSVRKAQLASELSHQLSLLKNLRQQILQDAVHGKLVPQDPSDESASHLLERIKAEKEKLIREKKIKPGKPLPPIKREEIPFEIPKGWVWCRLGRVIELTSGQDLKPNQYSDHETDGVPYITGASNLLNDKTIINRWTKHPKSLAFRGDLLITCKGSGVGKMGYLNEESAHIARQIMAIRCHIIAVQFIQRVIVTKVHEYRLNAKSLIPGIDRDTVLNTLIPLPPLGEQNRIVTKIDQLMHLCDKLEQAINQNQQYTRDLMQVALREALEGSLN